MSQSPKASAKTCVRCGVDCSDRPRIKDKGGRYCCAECYDRLKRSGEDAPAGAPASMQRRPVMIDLGDTPAAGTTVGATAHPGATGAVVPRAQPEPDPDEVLEAELEEITEPDPDEVALLCPACGVRMSAGDVVCDDCGFDTGRGGSREPRAGARDGAKKTSRDPEIPIFEAPATFGAFLRSPMGFGAILAAVFVGLFFAARADDRFHLPYLAAVAIFAALVFLATLGVAAGRGLLKLVLCLIPPYTLYFLFFEQRGRYLQAAAIVAAGAAGLAFHLGWAPLVDRLGM